MANTRTSSTRADTAGTSSSPAARLASLKNSRTNSAITWGDAHDSLVASVIESVTEAGCLISFGRTSDGGALSLAVVTDGVPVKFYAASREELGDILAGIADSFKD